MKKYHLVPTLLLTALTHTRGIHACDLISVEATYTASPPVKISSGLASVRPFKGGHKYLAVASRNHFNKNQEFKKVHGSYSQVVKQLLADNSPSATVYSYGDSLEVKFDADTQTIVALLNGKVSGFGIKSTGQSSKKITGFDFQEKLKVLEKIRLLSPDIDLSAIAKNVNFNHKHSANSHFKNHGVDVETNSIDEYVNQANKLLATNSPDILRVVARRAEDDSISITVIDLKSRLIVAAGWSDKTQRVFLRTHHKLDKTNDMAAVLLSSGGVKRISGTSIHKRRR